MAWGGGDDGQTDKETGVLCFLDLMLYSWFPLTFSVLWLEWEMIPVGSFNTWYSVGATVWKSVLELLGHAALLEKGLNWMGCGGGAVVNVSSPSCSLTFLISTKRKTFICPYLTLDAQPFLSSQDSPHWHEYAKEMLCLSDYYSLCLRDVFHHFPLP